ncbi:MAG: hypothetical protein ACK4QP_17300, partial [Pseudorhizobium sp.]
MLGLFQHEAPFVLFRRVFIMELLNAAETRSTGSAARRTNAAPFGSLGSVSDEAVATRTSPRGLERFIAGRTLVKRDGPAWKDLFVQVCSRHSH